MRPTGSPPAKHRATPTYPPHDMRRPGLTAERQQPPSESAASERVDPQNARQLGLLLQPGRTEHEQGDVQNHGGSSNATQLKALHRRTRLESRRSLPSVAAMPRKHFRKFLPSHESITRQSLHRISRSPPSSPQSLAPEPALGRGRRGDRNAVRDDSRVRSRCSRPAVLAVVLRVNLPVALAATWYINPFTIVPLYYLAYKIGDPLLTGEAPASDRSAPPFISRLDNIGDWIPGLLREWITALWASPCGRIWRHWGLRCRRRGYFAVRGAWRLYIVTAWRQRQRARPAASQRESRVASHRCVQHARRPVSGLRSIFAATL